MRKLRNCMGESPATGKSACQIDFGKIKAIILVAHGITLGNNLAKGKFIELCHADVPNRIYPIKTIVEYAKNGGEPQTSSVGYGGVGVTGISAQTDTFTLDKYSEHIASSLTKCMGKRFDAYYVDEDNLLIGVNNGTDVLGGIPMSAVYPTAVAHPTSGNKASLTISCCLEDARAAIENFDYVQLDFNPMDELVGLVRVDLAQVSANKYKLYETIGGHDRTAEFGPTIMNAATSVLNGATTASYNEADNTLSITPTSGSTVSLKSPSVLFASDIAGIEFNKTITE